MWPAPRLHLAGALQRTAAPCPLARACAVPVGLRSVCASPVSRVLVAVWGGGGGLEPVQMRRGSRAHIRSGGVVTSPPPARRPVYVLGGRRGRCPARTWLLGSPGALAWGIDGAVTTPHVLGGLRRVFGCLYGLRAPPCAPLGRPSRRLLLGGVRWCPVVRADGAGLAPVPRSCPTQCRRLSAALPFLMHGTRCLAVVRVWAGAVGPRAHGLLNGGMVSC